MKPETLEKLLAYIDLVKYGPFTPRAKARDELRALVKAESEPEAGFQPILDELDQIADEMSNEKGGQPCLSSSHSTTMNIGGSSKAVHPGASNPPSDVQAEGRGELLGFTEDEIVRAIYLSELSSHSAVSVKWNDGIDISRPSFAMLGFLKTLSNIRKINDASNPPPHNPDNLPSPGEGYRFLDEDEIQDGPMLREIHVWYKDRWVTDDPDGYCGWGKRDTYRTRLTREQLAQKRKEAGK